MVLNIFPRRREATAPINTEPETVLPEPSEAALEAPRRRTRVTRARVADASPAEAGDVPTIVADGATEAAEPVRRTRRAPRKAVEVTSEPEAIADVAPEPAAMEAQPAQPMDDEQSGLAPQTASGRSRSRRGRGGRGRGGANATQQPDQMENDDDADGGQPQPALGQAPSRLHREGQPTAREGDMRPVMRAIEQQGRQIEQLARAAEDMGRRSPGGSVSSAPPLRVGVFVDSANIELACDRLRARFDWAKVLRLVLKDRQLIRAIAYSPVHEDPGVSIETQRFIEPFLDRGFKLVTKPFRRFQDGTIKANLDIELALDVVTMLDRLDVVVLISGDGDFQRLVELAQSRGVRVEVASVATSTAANLRHAADEFIDLGARIRDIRL